jgi:tetratricopeptide (TPR) repeat protein
MENHEMTRSGIFGLLLLCVSAAVPAAWADDENKGQADLDKAIELQVGAESLSDLENVAKQCESALQKGLDTENQQFAKQLLSSTLYQHANQLCLPIFEQSPPDRRWPLLRQFAMKDLDRVVELDPNMGEAHLLIARLATLPQGDRNRGLEAAGKAVKLLQKDKRQLATAFVIRAQLRDNAEDRLEDYGRAIDADPSNTAAWQARALTFMAQGNLEKAIDDLNATLEQHGDNIGAHLALAEALTNLEKYDEAMTHVEKVVQLQPEAAMAYTLRARLHVIKEDVKAALADLNKALELDPTDLSARLIRSRLHQAEGDLTAAREDVDRVLLMSPNLPQGLLIRSMIYAQEGRLSDAIADMKAVLKQDPKNVGWRLQLAGYYLQDKRPTKAIEIFAQLVDEDKENWLARQARADTLLSIGKHAEAIADFEIVVKQQPEDDSILNNFAWVLATSPDEALRDGKRAIELATKACEVTEYKEAHILSTLAAAYAETGDFETAVKWSRKAVELGTPEGEVDEQLQNELKSYLEKKPWRERQTVEEKEDPVQQRRSRFEA